MCVALLKMGEIPVERVFWRGGVGGCGSFGPEEGCLVLLRWPSGPRAMVRLVWEPDSPGACVVA